MKNSTVKVIKELLSKGIDVDQINEVVPVGRSKIKRIKSLYDHCNVHKEYNSRLKKINRKEKEELKEKVRSIKYFLSEGIACNEIAKAFDISLGKVYKIRSLENYRTMGRKYNKKIRALSKVKKKKRFLKANEVVRISRMLDVGFKPQALAIQFDVSESTISKIKHKKHPFFIENMSHQTV